MGFILTRRYDVQLDGNLNKFPLRELIEMVVYSSVTGVLELRAGADIGQIFFRDGQPYHAVAGQRAGMDAIAAMFEDARSRGLIDPALDTRAYSAWFHGMTLGRTITEGGSVGNAAWLAVAIPAALAPLYPPSQV